MGKIIKKYLIVITLVIIIFLPTLTHAGLLKQSVTDELAQHEKAFIETSGFDLSANLGNTARIVIEAFLGLLAIIFIILVLLGGYNWMTAGGDESKVTKARDIIRQAIIGLIITVSAYAITYFVFNALPWGG